MVKNYEPNKIMRLIQPRAPETNLDPFHVANFFSLVLLRKWDNKEKGREAAGKKTKVQ